MLIHRTIFQSKSFRVSQNGITGIVIQAIISLFIARWIDFLIAISIEFRHVWKPFLYIGASFPQWAINKCHFSQGLIATPMRLSGVCMCGSNDTK